MKNPHNTINSFLIGFILIILTVSFIKNRWEYYDTPTGLYTKETKGPVLEFKIGDGWAVYGSEEYWLLHEIRGLRDSITEIHNPKPKLNKTSIYSYIGSESYFPQTRNGERYIEIYTEVTERKIRRRE